MDLNLNLAIGPATQGVSINDNLMWRGSPGYVFMCKRFKHLCAILAALEMVDLTSAAA
jgi:hypothetical protein